MNTLVFSTVAMLLIGKYLLPPPVFALSVQLPYFFKYQFVMIVSTLTSTLYVNPTSCAHDLDLWMKPPSHSIMSLRSHLDRYCSNRAMALDPISQSTRSRSPSRRSTTTTTASQFHCPPGWTPPAHRPHRPVIFMFDLKPMQRLAATNSYFNILSPPVAGNLSTPAYDGLFQTFKVIYPDYADSFYISDLQTLVVDTFLQRWSIHLQTSDFYMSIDTDQGEQLIDFQTRSLLDLLNWFYPTWKTHQHLDAFTTRSQTSLCITPHPDPHDTGFVVQVRVTPCGHPFFSSSSR